MMCRSFPIYLAFLLTLLSALVSADPFQPTLLGIDAPGFVDYQFDGAELKIPVTVTGTPAGIIFCLFTKDMADEIGYTINGYLGWHQVNKIDTCIYYSPMESYEVGRHEIVWDGRDQDGNFVSAGYYTYYLWGYDNKNERQLAASEVMPYCGIFDIQETDESGLPMPHPVIYEAQRRWTLGNDPSDGTLLDFSALPQSEFWNNENDNLHFTALDPARHDHFFVRASKTTYEQNPEQTESAILKLKWVAGGSSEIVSDWADNGCLVLPGALGTSSGIVSDGEYLYTSDDNSYYLDEPKADIYIVDMDDASVVDIDISEWWSSTI